jgi:putative transposase
LCKRLFGGTLQPSRRNNDRNKAHQAGQARSELIKLADSLLANHQKPEDLIGENGLLKQLTKMLVERALEAEMTSHLGHGKSG